MNENHRQNLPNDIKVTGAAGRPPSVGRTAEGAQRLKISAASQVYNISSASQLTQGFLGCEQLICKKACSKF